MRLKSLEKDVKRRATSAIAMLMRRGERGVQPDWRERPHRVLFLRHDRIGDAILSTGILRAIAESHPTIRLDVLASTANAAVLRNEPYLNEVIAFDRTRPSRYPRVFRELRRRRYDAVIDCMVTAPSLTTLLLMLASGARHRIGVAQRGNDFAYTLPVPPRESSQHIVDKLGALVTAFGLEPANVDLRPRVRLTTDEVELAERLWRGTSNDASDRRPRLLVNVSVGRAVRTWPDDRYVAVIRAARQHAPNAEIVVVSSPGDRARAARMAAEGGARLVATPDIRDVMAVVARADVVFTPDTSITHVCSAFDTPVVALFARGIAAIWGPYRTGGRAVESSTDSVTGITSDEAARVLVASLASRSAR